MQAAADHNRSRVLCKFFLHGACLKGDYCQFSHNWNDPANNVCTFYQKGICSYGSRCRYDHVKLSRPLSSSQSFLPASVPLDHPSDFASPGETSVLDSSSELSFSDSHLSLPTVPAWSQVTECNDISEDSPIHNPKGGLPADIPICSFAAVGSCPRGESCPDVHGDLCPSCGKHCLHPYRLAERKEHLRICEKMQKHLQLLKQSDEIECSVCLECVGSKPAAERKFGLLSECDHPFCISCIRNWRNSSPSSGMDMNSALRACPICRKLSYFVIPSIVWYSTKEEKREIVDSYKEKLKSIDCRHFDFGNGACPFGISCFYKHGYCDGSLEEVSLRHLGAEDGQIVIAKNIRLSDFFGNMNIS